MHGSIKIKSTSVIDNFLKKLTHPKWQHGSHWNTYPIQILFSGFEVARIYARARIILRITQIHARARSLCLKPHFCSKNKSRISDIWCWYGTYTYEQNCWYLMHLHFISMHNHHRAEEEEEHITYHILFLPALKRINNFHKRAAHIT